MQTCIPRALEFSRPSRCGQNVIAREHRRFTQTGDSKDQPARLFVQKQRAKLFVAGAAKKIGYVPQDDSLFPHLSVRRNLLYGTNSKSEHVTFSFDHVVDFLRITPLLDRDVRSLSRGEKQRIVIARALLSAPRLLLLDEPLTALDLKLKNAILEQLRFLHNEFGIPMLYVTHDHAEAIEICEKGLMLESGKITARGRPIELLA